MEVELEIEIEIETEIDIEMDIETEIDIEIQIEIDIAMEIQTEMEMEIEIQMETERDPPARRPLPVATPPAALDVYPLRRLLYNRSPTATRRRQATARGQGRCRRTPPTAGALAPGLSRRREHTATTPRGQVRYLGRPPPDSLEEVIQIGCS